MRIFDHRDEERRIRMKKKKIVSRSKGIEVKNMCLEQIQRDPQQVFAV